MVNLDGLANDAIIAFRKAGGTWPEYFAREKLDYYMDGCSTFNLRTNGIDHEVIKENPFMQQDAYIARIKHPAPPKASPETASGK